MNKSTMSNFVLKNLKSSLEEQFLDIAKSYRNYLEVFNYNDNPNCYQLDEDLTGFFISGVNGSGVDELLIKFNENMVFIKKSNKVKIFDILETNIEMNSEIFSVKDKINNDFLFSFSVTPSNNEQNKKGLTELNSYINSFLSSFFVYNSYESFVNKKSSKNILF